MTTDNIITIIASVLPTIILLFGGQFLLNRYEINRKSKEQEIELIRSVREKQYEAVQSLYYSFSKFMNLYRSINNPMTDLNNLDTQKDLLQKSIEAESEIDALILRISCEFTSDHQEELEYILGHLRQSVQIWRERILSKKRLPFDSSSQNDYIRFKESFAGTAAFMVHQIQNRLDKPQMRIKESRTLLTAVFSNKYEFEEYNSVFKEKW